MKHWNESDSRVKWLRYWSTHLPHFGRHADGGVKHAIHIKVFKGSTNFDPVEIKGNGGNGEIKSTSYNISLANEGFLRSWNYVAQTTIHLIFHKQV